MWRAPDTGMCCLQYGIGVGAKHADTMWFLAQMFKWIVRGAPKRTSQPPELV
jgi:hypothetical protein